MKGIGKHPLIIDTGFLIAILNKRDRHHQRAVESADLYDHRPWVTTWPIITETIHLLPTRLGIQLLEAQRDGLFHIFPIDPKDMERIVVLMKRYQDRGIDLADVSLIVLAEHLETGEILSCDKKDFSVLRWGRNRVFRNLFFD